MDSSFKQIIEAAKSILILLPQKPYFDQVAAGLGLFLALRSSKEVQISCPTSMTVEFNKLIGVNKITQELGNKNLIIKFTDYKANDIERVSYDIENSQFRLSVIPKQRVSPPTKEQIELTYSGVSSDCVILIGGGNETHFPALTSKELSSVNLVHIGLKDITLPTGRSYSSFSKPSSSVSEIIVGLVKEAALSFDEDMATDLLMGIEDGSKNFTDATVTADTFALVSELMKKGAKRHAAVTAQQQPLARAYPPFVPPSNFSKPANFQQPQTTSTQSTEDDLQKEPPQDWLRPKFFKGTSVS